MTEAGTFDLLSPRVRALLDQSGMKVPTPPQVEGIPPILRGENVLIVAPTGSGKTEAAILPLLSNIAASGERQGISLLYITPLRALNRDMLRRLRYWCGELSLALDIRHGDTPPSQRQSQSRNPPDVLVTTPETLQAMLPGRRMRDHLAGVRAVVVDELHNFVESKRGVQLTVGLRRLRRVAGDFQLVALSATIGSPSRAADFLFGHDPRQLVIAPAAKQAGYLAEYTTPRAEDGFLTKDAYTGIDMASRLARINDLVESHRSTLVFVNSRTVAEMLGEKLNRIRGDVGVHHGSLTREERERVETAFRSGQLKALVCTSTLELGIDVGEVDLVVQYMSPRQVTSLIQRVGRSGHSLERRSKGVILAVGADDVLESTAAALEAESKRMEETVPYERSLDVLAHQIAGYLMDFETMECDALLREFKECYPYRDIDQGTLSRVLSYMGEIRKLGTDGKSVWRTRGTREYYFENLSTIPDETRYLVLDVANNQSVGILGEEFVVLHAKVGLHFILKGRIWQIEKIADDRKIYVTSVEDPLAAIPGWDGELIPVPMALAKKSGELRRVVAGLVSSLTPEEAAKVISRDMPVSESGARVVAEEIAEQVKLGAPIPSDELVLLEGWQKYLVVHLCFGEKVNRLLAYAFEEVLSRRGLIRLWYADGYRLLIELTADAAELDLKRLSSELFGMSPAQLEETYAVAIQRNFPFPTRVKQVAERFGALRRGQFVAHPNLCSLPTRFENTPIFEEALQETGRDMIDMARAKELLADIAGGRVRLETFISEERPTPMAYNMLYRYLEVPELVEPDSLAKNTLDRLKLSIQSTGVELICMKCGESQAPCRIAELAEEPRCTRCGLGLLAPSFWSGGRTAMLASKKISHQEMTADENAELAKARRSADLVLSYGKRAVIAQAVYGVGPQTAARILAKMHDDEEAFYRDLIEAKLKFIETRPFW